MDNTAQTLPTEGASWRSHLFSYSHSEHYTDCWTRAAAPGGRLPRFHWCAFLFSDLWLLYRKQYALALTFWGVYLLGFFLLIALWVSFSPLLFLAGPVLEHITQTAWLITLLLSLGMRLLLGCYAYRLYLRQATATIRKLQTRISNPEDLNSVLFYKGGVSTVAVMVGMVGHLVLNMLEKTM